MLSRMESPQPLYSFNVVFGRLVVCFVFLFQCFITHYIFPLYCNSTWWLLSLLPSLDTSENNLTTDFSKYSWGCQRTKKYVFSPEGSASAPPMSLCTFSSPLAITMVFRQIPQCTPVCLVLGSPALQVYLTNAEREVSPLDLLAMLCQNAAQ